MGGVEGHGEEVGAHSVVEDTASPGAVVGSGLVDNVPCVAVALEVADDVGDVSLDDALELGSSETTARD